MQMSSLKALSRAVTNITELQVSVDGVVAGSVVTTGGWSTEHVEEIFTSRVGPID